MGSRSRGGEETGKGKGCCKVGEGGDIKGGLSGERGEMVGRRRDGMKVRGED